jgi:hypothetical protein
MFVQYVRPTDEELFEVSWASASREAVSTAALVTYT